MVQWYRPPAVVVSIPLMYQYLIYDILLWNTCSRLEWQQSLTSLDTFTCQLILILVYLLRILNVCLDKDVDPLVLGELAIGVLAHGPQVLPLDLRAPFLLLLLVVVHQEPTHPDIYVPPLEVSAIIGMVFFCTSDIWTSFRKSEYSMIIFVSNYWKSVKDR